MSRKLSWLLAAVACVAPPIWAYVATTSDLNTQRAAYGFVKCGTPMISIILLACIASGALSMVATGFGVASIRLIPKPRPKIRLFELLVLLLPTLVAAFIFASILWA